MFQLRLRWREWRRDVWSARHEAARASSNQERKIRGVIGYENRDRLGLALRKYTYYKTRLGAHPHTDEQLAKAKALRLKR